MKQKSNNFLRKFDEISKNLKSLKIFFETHPNSTYGIKFSTLNYSFYEKVYSYPLYSIAKVISSKQEDIKNSFKFLF